MKVHASQIPEESGKPHRIKEGKPSNVTAKIDDSSSLSLDEIEELVDKSLECSATVVKEGDESQENDEEKVKKFVVSFPDFGITISLFDIQTLDKDMRFVENQNHPRWQYGIIINKGITPSQRLPVTNKEMWFEKEEVRDERYDNILEQLKQIGFKVIIM